MSVAPVRYCAQPHCGRFAVKRGRCARHQKQEAERPNADVRKWYAGPRWKELRARVLRAQPFCSECAAEGFRVATTDADHVIPHRGDPALFWNPANLQAKCHRHHSAKTGRGE